MNVELARANMIEQQIRSWEVLDPAILHCIESVPREAFVPARFRELAFADMQIPLGDGEVMMQPKVEARLVQELELTERDRVLEVGTGTGYVSALLAKLAREVVSVEIRADFSETAARNLRRHEIRNVHLEVGDGARGWASETPFDAILIGGSLPSLPDAFRRILAPRGRLVAIIGQPPVMEAVLVTRIDDGGWTRQSLFDTALPMLRNAEQPPAFVF